MQARKDLHSVLPRLSWDLRNILPFTISFKSLKNQKPRVPTLEGGISCTLLGFPLEVQDVISRNNHQFDIKYAKKASIHHYDTIAPGDWSIAREEAAAAEKDYDMGFYTWDQGEGEGHGEEE